MSNTQLQDNKIKKLLDVFESIDKDTVHIDDVKRVFEALMEVMGKLKAYVEDELKDGKDDICEMSDQVTSFGEDIDSIFKTLDRMEVSISSKVTPDDLKETKDLLRGLIDEVRSLIQPFPSLESYDERLDALEEKEIEFPVHVTPTELENVVTSFKKEISDELKLIRDQIAKVQSTRSGNVTGMRKVPVIKKFSLTSQCNGSTKAFSLPPDTTDVLGVFGTQFPVQYDPSGDWTFSGRTLTLGAGVSAPQSGQTLWAMIEVLFY